MPPIHIDAQTAGANSMISGCDFAGGAYKKAPSHVLIAAHSNKKMQKECNCDSLHVAELYGTFSTRPDSYEVVISFDANFDQRQEIASFMAQAKRNTLRIAGVAAVVLLGSTAGLALAAGGSSAQTNIETRQKHLKDLGAALKVVRDETRKSGPNMVEVKSAAAVIAKAGAEIHTWFPQGSGPESKLKTAAKAEIWSDPQGFQTAAKNFATEAPKLQQLANANDVDGLKAQVGKLGGTCKGCHDNYRVPQD